MLVTLVASNCSCRTGPSWALVFIIIKPVEAHHTTTVPVIFFRRMRYRAAPRMSMYIAHDVLLSSVLIRKRHTCSARADSVDELSLRVFTHSRLPSAAMEFGYGAHHTLSYWYLAAFGARTKQRTAASSNSGVQHLLACSVLEYLCSGNVSRGLHTAKYMSSSCGYTAREKVPYIANNAMSSFLCILPSS